MKRRVAVQCMAVLLAMTMTSCGGDSVPASSVATQTEAIANSEDTAVSASEAAFAAEEPEKPEEAEAIDAEPPLDTTQLNSIAMLNHLAITAEKIRQAQHNRLMLEEIYDSLLNDINPGSVDETTQNHLRNLRDDIKECMTLEAKRERLQYIYNQRKAAAIRSAVPNPLAVLSMTNTLNWKSLAMSAVYTLVDSYNNYKGAKEAADQEFILSGWELNDEEKQTIAKNREAAFDYMVDVVRSNNLDGRLTLSEEAIQTYAELCKITPVSDRRDRLVIEEKTYSLLGDYWLELANCYFETGEYQACLDCVDRYKELSIDIYRTDYNYIKFLPKAIVAVQNVFHGEDYIAKIGSFADEIVNGAKSEEWSLRYFAAQAYLELYQKTGDAVYQEKAYKAVEKNVAVLIENQKKLENTYEEDFKEPNGRPQKPEYSLLTSDEKKAAKKKYEEEDKQWKAYCKSLKEIRKTELPPLDEAFLLNCDLWIALANEMQIDDLEKNKIDAKLSSAFVTKPVKDYYSFTPQTEKYSIDFSKKEIVIPVDLLTPDVEIIVTVTDEGKTTKFEDCKITEVERKGESVDTFYAHVSSKQMEAYKWTKNSRVTVTISNGSYGQIVFKYRVKDFKNNRIFPDEVVFERT